MSGIKLKLQVKTKGPELNAQARAPSVGTPGTPLAGTPRPKPMLSFKTKSQPSTPAPVVETLPQPKKTKAGRLPKQSAKLVESKKRGNEDSDNDDAGSTIAANRPTKKIKLKLGSQASKSLKTPITPVVLKAKHKGKLPPRPPGDGYDSEASDRELDPSIEEEFVLRMLPGPDCDYLRQAIQDKKIGVPKSLGGADVSMKFFNNEGRRAVVTVRGRMYAATMVDLPCIIEGMKSWDKRGFWKSADICQMLLVFAPVSSEAEAQVIALPAEIDQSNHQYPHGLTPPMHYARKRRFRKRLHKSTIEAVEDAVNALLAKDEEAVSTSFVVFDRDAERDHGFSRAGTGEEEEEDEYDEEDDAEGEAEDEGYFNQAANGHVNGDMNGGLDDDDVAAMEADMEADFENAFEEAEVESAVATPSMINGGQEGMTPAGQIDEEEDSGDESFEEEDGDENGGEGVVDEEEQKRLLELQGTREDIAELEQSIVNVESQISSQSNPILKRRLEDNLKKLKQELQLKKSSIDEGEDNE